MYHTLFNYDVSSAKVNVEEDDSKRLIDSFIAAKRIEGCSEKTLKYYQNTITAMVSDINKNVRRILT